MPLKGLRADRLIIDDPFDTKPEVDPAKVAFWYKEVMSYSQRNTVPDNGFNTAKKAEAKKQRFGRVVKDYDRLGELRRQKKEPHTEVLYIWVTDGVGQGWEGRILRSVNNCTNDQLTEAIRHTGEMADSHRVDRTDAETVLDLLYKALQQRVEGAEKIRARRVPSAE